MMKGSFNKKQSRGLPGGPNQQFTYVTGVFMQDMYHVPNISTEGYKSNSPDVNNPFNIIPSGNITMKGVDFPVRGVDNLGNEKIMYPGEEHQFPGDMVYETPVAQKGKSFEDWYKSVPTEKSDTSLYNLRRAFELAPKKDLHEFTNDPNSHLYTVYPNNKGEYEFIKSKNHPTLQKELDWYYSNKGSDFRSKYELDTSEDFYKYVPRKPKAQKGYQVPGLQKRMQHDSRSKFQKGDTYPFKFTARPSKEDKLVKNINLGAKYNLSPEFSVSGNLNQNLSNLGWTPPPKGKTPTYLKDIYENRPGIESNIPTMNLKGQYDITPDFSLSSGVSTNFQDPTNFNAAATFNKGPSGFGGRFNTDFINNRNLSLEARQQFGDNSNVLANFDTNFDNKKNLNLEVGQKAGLLKFTGKFNTDFDESNRLGLGVDTKLGKNVNLNTRFDTDFKNVSIGTGLDIKVNPSLNIRGGVGYNTNDEFSGNVGLSYNPNIRKPQPKRNIFNPEPKRNIYDKEYEKRFKQQGGEFQRLVNKYTTQGWASLNPQEQQFYRESYQKKDEIDWENLYPGGAAQVQTDATYTKPTIKTSDSYRQQQKELAEERERIELEEEKNKRGQEMLEQIETGLSADQRPTLYNTLGAGFNTALTALGTPAATVGEIAAGLSGQGFHPSNIVSVPSKQRFLSDVTGMSGTWGGLGLDIITDPSTWIGGSMIRQGLKKATPKSQVFNKGTRGEYKLSEVDDFKSKMPSFNVASNQAAQSKNYIPMESYLMRGQGSIQSQRRINAAVEELKKNIPKNDPFTFLNNELIEKNKNLTEGFPTYDKVTKRNLAIEQAQKKAFDQGASLTEKWILNDPVKYHEIQKNIDHLLSIGHSSKSEYIRSLKAAQEKFVNKEFKDKAEFIKKELGLIHGKKNDFLNLPDLKSRGKLVQAGDDLHNFNTYDREYLRKNWEGIGGARTDYSTITKGSNFAKQLGLWKHSPTAKFSIKNPSTWGTMIGKPKIHHEHSQLINIKDRIYKSPKEVRGTAMHEYGHMNMDMMLKLLMVVGVMGCRNMIKNMAIMFLEMIQNLLKK